MTDRKFRVQSSLFRSLCISRSLHSFLFFFLQVAAAAAAAAAAASPRQLSSAIMAGLQSVRSPRHSQRSSSHPAPPLESARDRQNRWMTVATEATAADGTKRLCVGSSSGGDGASSLGTGDEEGAPSAADYFWKIRDLAKASSVRHDDDHDPTTKSLLSAIYKSRNNGSIDEDPNGADGGLMRDERKRL
jgi:hypothetical protein